MYYIPLTFNLLQFLASNADGVSKKGELVS